jgi:hypothetical protein
MNGLPGDSLHTANTCSTKPIKKIHHLSYILKFDGSVYEGNVLMVESACVCACVKCHTCSNICQMAYCIIHIISCHKSQQAKRLLCHTLHFQKCKLAAVLANNIDCDNLCTTVYHDGFHTFNTSNGTQSQSLKAW